MNEAGSSERAQFDLTTPPRRSLPFYLERRNFPLKLLGYCIATGAQVSA
jgi:hypothetical protein